MLKIQPPPPPIVLKIRQIFVDPFPFARICTCYFTIRNNDHNSSKFFINNHKHGIWQHQIRFRQTNGVFYITYYCSKAHGLTINYWTDGLKRVTIHKNGRLYGLALETCDDQISTFCHQIHGADIYWKLIMEAPTLWKKRWKKLKHIILNLSDYLNELHQR